MATGAAATLGAAFGWRRLRWSAVGGQASSHTGGEGRQEHGKGQQPEKPSSHMSGVDS